VLDREASLAQVAQGFSTFKYITATDLKAESHSHARSADQSIKKRHDSESQSLDTDH
jgi:hypothetical protein